MSAWLVVVLVPAALWLAFGAAITVYALAKQEAEIRSTQPRIDIRFIPGLVETRRSNDLAGDDAGITIRYQTSFQRAEILRLLQSNLKHSDGWTPLQLDSGGTATMYRNEAEKIQQRVRVVNADRQGRTTIWLKDYHPEWTDSGRHLPTFLK